MGGIMGESRRAPVLIDSAMWSEATVAAELYHRARMRGLAVALEVYLGSLRADVAFFHPGSEEVYALVEVKRSVATRDKWGRQPSKYGDTGIPWRYCEGREQIGLSLLWAERARELSMSAARAVCAGVQ